MDPRMIDLTNELKHTIEVLRRHDPKSIFVVKQLVNQLKRESDLRKSYERDLVEQSQMIAALREER